MERSNLPSHGEDASEIVPGIWLHLRSTQRHIHLAVLIHDESLTNSKVDVEPQLPHKLKHTNLVLKKTNADEFSGTLKDAYQMLKINNFLPEFNVFFDFITKLFKYERHAEDAVDLFFSFVSKVGAAHRDTEDVFIIGLKGKVIYRVFDTETVDYKINKGDMMFIPKGLKHKVLAITPRIIASIGFFGKKNND